MTEQEWLYSTDVAKMLGWLMRCPVSDAVPVAYPPSARKRSLFIDAFHSLGFCHIEKSAVDLAHIGECLRDEPNKRFQPIVANFLRDIVGNPWCPLVLPKSRMLVDIGPWEVDNYTITHGYGEEYCPWLTPDVLSLAQAAYENRVGRECAKCSSGLLSCPKCSGEGCSAYSIAANGPCTAGDKCPDCSATGRIEDGSLDPARLAVLSDALEEAGCPTPNGRTLSQVIEAQSHAVMGGCCNRFADQMACDCLQEAEPDGLLSHLRSPGPHFRGCYVLDLILNKE